MRKSPGKEYILIKLQKKVYKYTIINATGAKKQVLNDKITLTIESIKANEEWLQDVQEKAIKNGISLDSMLYLDAVWVIENSK